MPIEKVEDVLTVLGYKADEFADTKTLKERIEKDFFRSNGVVPPEVKKEITKSMVSSLTRDAKWLTKNEGVSLEDSEIQGKEIEEVYKLAFERVADKYKTEIETLQGQIGKPDEAMSKLQKEYDKLNKAKEDAVTQATTLANEFNTYKVTTETTYRQEKLESEKAKSRAEKVQFIDKLPDVSKDGYYSNLDTKFKWDLDESKKLIVLGLDGNPIPKPGVANAFMQPEDIYQAVGLEKKTWPINPHAKNQFQTIPQERQRQQEQPEPDPTNRRVVRKPIS